MRRLILLLLLLCSMSILLADEISIDPLKLYNRSRITVSYNMLYKHQARQGIEKISIADVFSLAEYDKEVEYFRSRINNFRLREYISLSTFVVGSAAVIAGFSISFTDDLQTEANTLLISGLAASVLGLSFGFVNDVFLYLDSTESQLIYDAARDYNLSLIADIMNTDNPEEYIEKGFIVDP